MRLFKNFLRDERGTETVEWAIIVGIIGAVSMLVILSINSWVNQRYTTTREDLAVYVLP
ncbi:MAG: Flp family type IVb pilin [Planctomycetota bacterium]|jgi:Flp pilus assembly pilin Flp